MSEGCGFNNKRIIFLPKGEKMEDFSNYFTVEQFGSKGWEVIWKGVSLKDALDHVDRIFPFDYQLRITWPVINAVGSSR